MGARRSFGAIRAPCQPGTGEKDREGGERVQRWGEIRWIPVGLPHTQSSPGRRLVIYQCLRELSSWQCGSICSVLLIELAGSSRRPVSVKAQRQVREPRASQLFMIVVINRAENKAQTEGNPTFCRLIFIRHPIHRRNICKERFVSKSDYTNFYIETI